MNFDYMLQSILKWLKIPTTHENMTSIAAWARSEAMPQFTFNPLGAHQVTPYSNKLDTTGRQSYMTLNEGIIATAQELNGSAYSDIVSTMKNDGTYLDIWKAIHCSGWNPFSKKTLYPEVLHDIAINVIKNDAHSTTGEGATRPASQIDSGNIIGSAIDSGVDGLKDKFTRISDSVRAISRFYQ